MFEEWHLENKLKNYNKPILFSEFDGSETYFLYQITI